MNKHILLAPLVFMVILAANTSAAAQKPMTIPGYPDMFQRVLTLPGASIYLNPSLEEASTRLNVFSILYVFAQKQTDVDWLQVGRDMDAGPEGWIEEEYAQEWNMMLVMQFAKGVKRSPAIFFEKQEDIEKLVESPALRRNAKMLLDSLKEGKPDKRLIASEVDDGRVGGISFDSQPYVFPILSHQSSGFDSGQPVTLLEVASVTATGKQSEDPNGARSRESIRNSMIGAAFVIDTTISMQSYIDGAKEMASNLAGVLKDSATSQKLRFAAVGYRNNMDAEPQKSGLEYVSRTFLDFGSQADSLALKNALGKMNAARVSTHSISEDAIAGLEQAINSLNWQGIDTRLIFLITDAGALDGDPKSKYPELNLTRIKARAVGKNIVIIPIHLVTPAARKSGNEVVAQSQYESLGDTGDINLPKYIKIDGGSKQSYAESLKQFEAPMAKVLPKMVAGEPVNEEDYPNDGGLGDIVVNEIFRTQQKMIGALKGDTATGFLKGWTVDTDLVDPKLQRKTMQVSVFLTRNQLNDLGRQLASILDKAKAAQTTPDAFFKELQSLAANTSQDPNRDYKSIAELNLLPSYLELLPYEPEIFKLTQPAWISKTFGEQQALIDDMVFKVGTYKDIESSKQWVSLVKNDRGQDVYPVPLAYLP